MEPSKGVLDNALLSLGITQLLMCPLRWHSGPCDVIKAFKGRRVVKRSLLPNDCKGVEGWCGLLHSKICAT